VAEQTAASSSGLLPQQRQSPRAAQASNVLDHDAAGGGLAVDRLVEVGASGCGWWCRPGATGPVRAALRCLPVVLRSRIPGVGYPAASARVSASMVRRASIPLEARVRKIPMPSAPRGWASYPVAWMPARWQGSGAS
jgi:hypothetical protein